MKKSILAVLVSVALLSAQTIVPGGNIYTTTWTKMDSPYFVYGDLVIPHGEKLTIKPGVQVVFFGWYYLNVQGSLVAKGSAEEMITFTSSNPETKWFGIKFWYTPSDSPSSYIEYCHITNSKTYQDELPGQDAWDKRHGGGIYFRDFSKATVADCIIENNIAASGGGISMMYSSPTIKDNVIRNNRAQGPSSGWGGGITIGPGSDPMVKGNTIEYNVCVGDQNYAGGSGIYIQQADPKIMNNIIRYNSISYSKYDKNYKGFDGAAFYIHTASPQILGNLIYGNSNAIENGGGFWMYRCNSKIVNNTIKSNYASLGGGFFLRESDPVFHNNIIRYNDAVGEGDQFYLDDPDCDPDFYHNNIQGGLECFAGPGSGSYFSGAWVNNIDEDPKYEGGSKEYSFKLTNESNCIDQGITDIPDIELPLEDIDGNLRIWNISKGSIDMGAYEYGSPAAVLQAPVNIETVTDSNSIQLLWDSVDGALYYRVLSSDDNVNFEEDFTGVFNNCSWSVPVSSSRKFYRVVAVN